MRMVFLKSTVLPLGVCNRPSSRTCSSTLNTPVGLFSTRRRAPPRGFRRTASRQLAALPVAHVSPGGAPMSRDTANFSIYSDMSMRTRLLSSSNRASARALGQLRLACRCKNFQEQEGADGAVGVLNSGPAPLNGLGDGPARLCPGPPPGGRVRSRVRSFFPPPWTSLATGMPVHRSTNFGDFSSVTLSRSMLDLGVLGDLVLRLQAALGLGQAAVLPARRPLQIALLGLGFGGSAPRICSRSQAAPGRWRFSSFSHWAFLS